MPLNNFSQILTIYKISSNLLTYCLSQRGEEDTLSEPIDRNMSFKDLLPKKGTDESNIFKHLISILGILNLYTTITFLYTNNF